MSGFCQGWQTGPKTPPSIISNHQIIPVRSSGRQVWIQVGQFSCHQQISIASNLIIRPSLRPSSNLLLPSSLTVKVNNVTTNTILASDSPRALKRFDEFEFSPEKLVQLITNFPVDCCTKSHPKPLHFPLDFQVNNASNNPISVSETFMGVQEAFDHHLEELDLTSMDGNSSSPLNTHGRCMIWSKTRGEMGI